METRINHGQSDWLEAWFQDRCHRGFEVSEAECQCLRMYYRFDSIPMLTPDNRRSAPIYDYALGEAVFHRLQPDLD